MRVYSALDNNWLLPCLGGVGVALCSSLILHFKYIWAWLVLVGLTVVVLSLTAKNFTDYWLAIFALALPLEIRKVLINSDYMRNLADIYGFPLGELPGPVLYLMDLPLLVLLIYWLLRIVFKKEKIFFPKSNWMALALIFWSGLSLVNSTALSYSIFDLLRMIKFYLLYLFIANNVRSARSLRILMVFFLIGMIFQSLICLYQYKTQNITHIFGNLFGEQGLYNEKTTQKYKVFFNVAEEGNFQQRASGTVGPHNAEAQYFAFLLPVIFLLWLTANNLGSGFINLIIFLIGLSGLVVTFSRGAFIGLAVGIVAALFLSRLCRLISSRKLLMLFLLGLTITLASVPLAYKFIMTRPEATRGRLQLLQVGLDMVKAHPFLGVGLNNHLVVKSKFDPQDYLMPTPIHNRYILVASEVGIPGLMFYLVFWGMTGLSAWQAAQVEDLYLAAIGVGIFGALLAVAVHNLVDHASNHATLTLFWLYAGLAAAITKWGNIPKVKAY